MVEASGTRYLRSLAQELVSQANRVRDLIGSHHWLTDGSHKEFLISEVLRRHLPGSHLVGRGFVVDSVRPDSCSREQDVLIVDTEHEAPIFHQGGVIIAFSASVRAVISVKTTMGPEEVRDAVDTLHSARNVAYQPGSGAERMWRGAFFFEPNEAVQRHPEKAYEYVESAVVRMNDLDHSELPDLGPEFFATAESLLLRQYPQEDGRSKIVGFSCSGLASAVFLARILDHLATERGVRRSDFADFASLPQVAGLSPPDHTYQASTKRA